MKRKLFIPIALVVLIILSILSPYLIKDIQELFVVNEYHAEKIFETQITSLKVNDYVKFGKYNNQPILWKIIDTDNGNILLMSEYILCFKAFDANGKSDAFHKTDSELYGSSSWENSSIKQWLNSDEINVTYSHCAPDKNSTFKSQNPYSEESGFLSDKNFSSFERNLIGDEGVFLLSKQQLKKYFTNTSRRKTATPDAILCNNSPYLMSTSKAVWFWTSSPVSSNNVSVTAVTSSGTFYKSLAYDGAMGVCPALYLKTSELCVNNATGTKEDPYVICDYEVNK